MSIASKGKSKSEEHKRKMSENRKKNPLRYWLGKKRPEMSGKNHFAWKGGISRGYRKGYKTDLKYKNWRSGVFERDNWTCQTCGIRGIYLEAHHIKSWAKFPELRYELDNGVTLCKECHKLTANYKNLKNNN